MSTQPEKIAVSDSVTYRLGNKTSKPFYKAIKKRAPRLIHNRKFHYDRIGVTGFVVAKLFGPDGQLKQVEQGENLVTDYGDEHLAKRVFDDAALIVTGMRLGTGSTPEAKAGAGSFIVSYIATSNEDLDGVATFFDKGAGSGARAVHVCTWIAGDITNGAIAEVALSDETPLTDVQGVAIDTVAKFIFASTIDKQVGDSLEVTWNIDLLGA